MSEEKTETTTIAREYGFTIMVKADGSIVLTPINLNNDFELAGLIDYASQKKTELMQTISMSPEIKTVNALGALTSILGKVVTASVTRETDTDDQDNDTQIG